MSAVLDFISILDEATLISFSNAGIFKKAQKELETAVIKIEQNEPLIVSVDEHKVTFKDAKKEGLICTCPDSKFCKHRIISILFLQKNISSSIKEEKKEVKEEKVEDIYKDLFEPNLEQLKKIFGKSEFEKGVKYFFKVKVTFEQKPNALSFTLLNEIQNDTQTTNFLSINPLQNITCSCKTKKCVHQIASILQFQIQLGKLSRDELKELVKEELETIDEKLLKNIENFVYELINIGLSKITNLQLTRLRKFGYKIHYESPLLEKALYGIEEQLSLFLNKSGSFSVNSFKNSLLKPIKIIRLYKTYKDDTKFMHDLTKVKSDYYDVSSLELNGIGKEYVEFNNGSNGLFLYFINSNNIIYKRGSFLTNYGGGYSQSSTDPRRTLLETPIWGENESGRGEYNVESFMNKSFTLLKTKVNDENNISSKAKVILGEEHNFNFPFVYDDFNKLKNNFIEFRRETLGVKVGYNPFYAIIKVKNHGELDFNFTSQEILIPIYDINENKIFIQYKYKGSSDTYQNERKFLFDNIQKIFKNENYPKPTKYFGKVYFDKGITYFLPISAYYDTLSSNFKRLYNIDIDGFYMLPEVQPKKR